MPSALMLLILLEMDLKALLAQFLVMGRIGCKRKGKMRMIEEKMPYLYYYKTQSHVRVDLSTAMKDWTEK